MRLRKKYDPKTENSSPHARRNYRFATGKSNAALPGPGSRKFTKPCLAIAITSASRDLPCCGVIAFEPVCAFSSEQAGGQRLGERRRYPEIVQHGDCKLHDPAIRYRHAGTRSAMTATIR
jgi:hypothetical protein